MRSLSGFKATLLTSILAFSAVTASAHEVWLEREGDGPVRIYLGEPGEPDTGEKIDNLKNARVFTDNRELPATLSQNDDHWAATVSRAGDVRLFTDQVWQPWEMNDVEWWEFWKEDSALQGAILEAREGRTETSAKLTFELVPVTSGGHVFTALFQGEPLANQALMLLTPSKKEIELTSDNKGLVEVTLTEKGRFVLSGVHAIETDAMHSGKKVASLMYITSLSFVSE